MMSITRLFFSHMPSSAYPWWSAWHSCPLYRQFRRILSLPVLRCTQFGWSGIPESSDYWLFLYVSFYKIPSFYYIYVFKPIRKGWQFGREWVWAAFFCQPLIYWFENAELYPAFSFEVINLRFDFSFFFPRMTALSLIIFSSALVNPLWNLSPHYLRRLLSRSGCGWWGVSALRGRRRSAARPISPELWADFICYRSHHNDGHGAHPDWLTHRVRYPRGDIQFSKSLRTWWVKLLPLVR